MRNHAYHLTKPERVLESDRLAAEGRRRIARLTSVLQDDWRHDDRAARLRVVERPRREPDLSARLALASLLEFVGLMAFLAVMTGLIFMFG